MIKREKAIEMLKSKMDGSVDTSYEWAETVRMAIKALSADAVPQLKQTDTLIIADALRYLAEDTKRHELDRMRAKKLREQYLSYGANMKGNSGEWQSS